MANNNDAVAERMAEAAASMVGKYTDQIFPTWDVCTDNQKEWWRELARVSQGDDKPKKGAKG